METASKRLLSLDVFRGATIAGMILVNSPGDWGNIYSALRHAHWNGVTPTDLIFPFFLFIVGVAITFSLTKRKERGDNASKLYIQIFRRTIIIFMLGIILNGFPYYHLSSIRIPGVLQRIAVVYCITSILFLKFSIKTQAIISFTLLFIYWGMMALIPVPGVGYANLGQSTNLGAWLDNLILGGHLWEVSKTWDPEGIISTIPAISTGIFGVLTGNYLLKSSNDKTTKTVWMFVIGNFALLLSMFWDMWFPINKQLWTSSYVIYTGGMALIIFAVCYYLADVKNYTWWTKPFIIYGTNAIAVYFLSWIFGVVLYLINWTSAGQVITLKDFLYNTFFTSWLSPINASLLWAVAYVLFWLGIMWIFYARKIFIKA
jgi:predicted acyltransferase